MVEGTVLGKDVSLLNFKSESGENISGWRLWVGFTEADFEGLMPVKYFVRPESEIPIAKLQVGADYAFDFDRRGRMVGVSAIAKKGGGA